MRTKTCSQCRIQKPEDCFWKRPDSSDGRWYHCIDCARRRIKAVRQTPEHRAWLDDYKIRNRDKIVAKMRRYRQRHGLTRGGTRRPAHDIVAAAIKAGTLIRPKKCEHCLKLRRVQAHHDNYDKPLDVRWLCQRCHSRLHAGLLEVA